MRSHRVVRLFTAVAALAAPVSLGAQAFGLNEIGSCAIGRGFATTASPCRDPSTIYWNSAAAASLPGWNVSLGAAVIAIKGRFKQDSTGAVFDADEPTKTIPNFFLNYHAPSSKAAWGIGVYVPYGLTSQWRPDFPGRFEAEKAALATIYVQPNFAWQLTDKWSIGGGPIWGHSTVELIQALDLSEQGTGIPGVSFASLGIASGTQFGIARLKGSASAFGAQIAVNGHPTPNWNVGVRFLTPLDFKYDNADATFTQTPTGLVIGGTVQPPFSAGTPIDSLVAPQFRTGGALVAQKVSTHINHPAQLQAGLSYSGYKDWLLEADYAWVGWKQFNVLPVNFKGSAPSRVLIEDYNNSSAIRLGAEYTIPTDGWKLRAGFAGVASAAPPETVTPLLPEQDRAYVTAGVGIPFMTRYSLDASYAHVSTPGARGRIVERTSESQTAADLNTGVYTLSANIFSFTLRASF
ncbi:MAG TPA: outer membrane protein transport protein [Gemmatimonadaceae bacterium]|nr:outer membrane protein transport protein [Gemmatimonadaceae bacterium]